MSTLTVYTKPGCGQCFMARRFLTSRGIQHAEVMLDIGQQHEAGITYIPIVEFKERYPHAKALPFIIKDDKTLGGYKDLQLAVLTGDLQPSR